MLLRYLGKEADPGAIVRETRTEGLRGTLITDLAAAARRRGVEAEVSRLDLGSVLGRLREGFPVILLVDLGAWAVSRPHYLLVYGILPDGVVAHSGREAGKRIPYATLDRQWKSMGYLAIVAGPRAGRTP